MVGSLYGRKRVDLAIASLPFVHSNLRLSVVGEGPKRGEYEKLAQSLGVYNRVRFLGRVNREVLVTLYSQADLLLLVSDREGSPVTLEEARSMGLSTMQVNSGPKASPITDELYDDGNLTVKISSNDPRVIAAELDSALSNPANRLRDLSGQKTEQLQFARASTERDVIESALSAAAGRTSKPGGA
jgi:glycosyltransferase involved in cell wall biosynthesis